MCVRICCDITSWLVEGGTVSAVHIPHAFARVIIANVRLCSWYYWVSVGMRSHATAVA